MKMLLELGFGRKPHNETENQSGRGGQQNGSIEQISRKPCAKRPVNTHSDRNSLRSFSLGTQRDLQDLNYHRGVRRKAGVKAAKGLNVKRVERGKWFRRLS